MSHEELHKQLRMFTNFLQGSRFEIGSQVFNKALQFIYLIKQHPVKFNEKEIRDLHSAVQLSFSLSNQDLQIALAGVTLDDLTGVVSTSPINKAEEDEQSLWQILPKEGFLYDYCTYTKEHEAPLAYHVFNAIAGVGAVASNRIWYNMGFYSLYPALGIILLGPPGVKKSTSAYCIVDRLIEWQYCNCYSEKITQEALTMTMSKNPTGLLFASELSVLLSKQKYMEGILPFITRMMDQRTFTAETKGGGKVTVVNPALSFIGCITPESFVADVPSSAFGGGFMRRFLIIYQEDSPRIDSSPGRDHDGNFVKIDSSIVHKLQESLGIVMNLKGEACFTQNAFRLYDDWYRESKVKWRSPEVPLLATYYQSKADRVKQVTMCLHLSTHQDLMLCESCFLTSVKLLDWIEQFIGPVYKEMFKSTSGLDNELVLKAIRTAGGVISHTNLTRAVSYKIDAFRLKGILQGLKEAQLIEEKHDKVQHCYLLTS